jgi:hypothetical protein
MTLLIVMGLLGGPAFLRPVATEPRRAGLQQIQMICISLGAGAYYATPPNNTHVAESSFTLPAMALLVSPQALKVARIYALAKFCPQLLTTFSCCTA